MFSLLDIGTLQHEFCQNLNQITTLEINMMYKWYILNLTTKVFCISEWQMDAQKVYWCGFLVLDDKAWLDILFFESFRELIMPQVKWKTTGQRGNTGPQLSSSPNFLYIEIIPSIISDGWLVDKTEVHLFRGVFAKIVFVWKTYQWFLPGPNWWCIRWRWWILHQIYCENFFLDPKFVKDILGREMKDSVSYLLYVLPLMLILGLGS